MDSGLGYTMYFFKGVDVTNHILQDMVHLLSAG